jgi:hypothetical protein
MSLTDDLAARGWEPQQVDPTNCVRRAWEKKIGTFKAEIKVYDQEVRAFLSAATQVTSGLITLKDFTDLNQAASAVEALASSIPAHPGQPQGRSMAA